MYINIIWNLLWLPLGRIEGDFSRSLGASAIADFNSGNLLIHESQYGGMCLREWAVEELREEIHKQSILSVKIMKTINNIYGVPTDL